MKDTNLAAAGIQIPQYTFSDPTTDAGASMGTAGAAFANDVDLSTWEMAVACGSCHVGGSVVEFDRNGLRHSMRPIDPLAFNADQNYVLEMFDDVTGLPIQYNNPFDPTNGTPADTTDDTRPGFGPAYAMWAMPGTFDNKLNNGIDLNADGFSDNAVIPGELMPNANGWAPQNFIDMGMAEAGQMMMPNVREMDCFYCHLSGFNNIISSVAVQMGYLNAAPSLSSGLMNMFSQTYMPGTTVQVPGSSAWGDFGVPVQLSGSFLTRLNGEPKQENCRQCHTPTTMENFSSMFDEFLAAAPMDYDPTAPGASLINGMVMPAYDLNAAFTPNSGALTVNGQPDYTTQDSRTVYFDWDTTDPMMPMPLGWKYEDDNSSAAGPFGLFPMALDTTWTMFNADGSPNESTAGGNKAGMSGPLYYKQAAASQNSYKKSTIPFPRADFFKRGDIWDDKSQEVHFNFGCAGCHYNTNSSYADLNQCDPGRGRTRMGGVESAQTLGIQDTPEVPSSGITVRKGIDTHDTVKSCKQCHVTGVNTEGLAIETFGAPNPAGAHGAAGLLANVTKARALNASGAEVDITGNHLDVIDCSVCHIYKKSMTVRSLDSTSGNRYPALIGFDGQNKGMMAMFTDPMYSDSLSDLEAVGAFTNNMKGMGATQGMVDYQLGQVKTALGTTSDGDAARYALKNPPLEWKPIYGWHANMPKYLPLADGTPGNATNGGAVNPEWRRVLVPINFIVAQMWDDAYHEFTGLTDNNDMNGDNAEADAAIPNVDIKWDPPISRDMKVGMNFAAGPFATIPVGFGSGAYQSAYNTDFSFSGAFQFVGVYGGNIMLTTPEEITAYKDHRIALTTAPGGNVPGTNRDWTNTQLVFQGGNPFQVTHNVVDTSQYAQGKGGCTDCHAPGSEFFSGGYDMTGSGVPASATIDLDGAGTMFNEISSNMMFRPVVDFEVMALKDDLRTGSEAKLKQTGAVLDVEFDSCLQADKTTPIDCADPLAIYRQTHDLERIEMMYPDETQLVDAAGNTYADYAAWQAYIEGITAADYAIGEAPVTDIETIGGVTASGGNTPIEFTAGSTVTLASGTAVNGATTTYTVYDIFSQEGDVPLTLTGSDVTFTNPGTYRVVLETVSSEGKIGYDTQYIVVTAPLDGVFTTSTATDNGDGTFALNVVIDPATLGFYDSVLVNFSDGEANLFYSGAATTFTKDVAGVTGDVKRVSVIFKNGLTTVDVWEVDITL